MRHVLSTLFYSSFTLLAAKLVLQIHSVRMPITLDRNFDRDGIVCLSEEKHKSRAVRNLQIIKEMFITEKFHKLFQIKMEIDLIF